MLDLDFGLTPDMLKVIRMADAVVWVGDGSEISNLKLSRAYQALSILEQNADSPLTNRLATIYNKYSSKTGAVLTDLGVRNLGGAPRYEHATTAQVLDQLAVRDCFDKLI